MANANRTIPMAWTDDLNDLNARLIAFQRMNSAYLEELLVGHRDASSIVRGVDITLESILEGYQAFVDQVQTLRDAYQLIDDHG